MKLSTRGRYGIRAMFDLALNAPDGTQSIKVIAEREGIPEAYLEQLFAPLKREGLVTSTRGAQGGYALARPADAISVGDILRAVEGSLNLAECLEGDHACEKADACPSRLVLKKLRDGMKEIVDGISLQDMIDDHRRACAQEDTTK